MAEAKRLLTAKHSILITWGEKKKKEKIKERKGKKDKLHVTKNSLLCLHPCICHVSLVTLLQNCNSTESDQRSIWLSTPSPTLAKSRCPGKIISKRYSDTSLEHSSNFQQFAV